MTNQSFPDITSVTSEALQLKIRQLLPSQTGFGSDLMAQNIIVPIIDLTATAEGSDVRSDLQSAMSFGGITDFNVRNATTTLITNPGFHRVLGTVACKTNSSANSTGQILLSDGSSDKIMFSLIQEGSGSLGYVSQSFDLLIYLDVGESCKILSNQVEVTLSGSTRQIANTSGELIQPVGFDPQ